MNANEPQQLVLGVESDHGQPVTFTLVTSGSAVGLVEVEGEPGPGDYEVSNHAYLTVQDRIRLVEFLLKTLL